MNTETRPRRILLATDLSPRCDRAFDRATLLARQWNARLTIACALEDWPEWFDRDSGPRWRRSDQEKEDAESQIREDLQRAGVTADIVVRRGRASDLILELAREISYDLIVTGIARSLGLTRSILGATVEALVRQRIAPVLVVKRRAREPYRSAVVGTNFSKSSRAALQATSALFQEAGLTVLHAYRTPLQGLRGANVTDDAAHAHALNECVHFVAQALPVGADRIRCLAELGFPETLLNQYAIDKRVDLIAVGTQIRTAMLALLFGSTSSALVLSSPCDLLLVPTEPASLALENRGVCPAGEALEGGRADKGVAGSVELG